MNLIRKTKSRYSLAEFCLMKRKKKKKKSNASIVGQTMTYTAKKIANDTIGFLLKFYKEQELLISK